LCSRFYPAFTRIDVRGLSGNTRRLIPERVKSELGFN